MSTLVRIANDCLTGASQANMPNGSLIGVEKYAQADGSEAVKLIAVGSCGSTQSMVLTEDSLNVIQTMLKNLNDNTPEAKSVEDQRLVEAGKFLDNRMEEILSILDGYRPIQTETTRSMKVHMVLVS